MARNYYRSSAPSTWGTSNYRFSHPPEPLFRPQPTWGGLDYYQAHALDPDSRLYHRIQEGRYDAEGVGLHEARHWHRQAYGGFGDVRLLTPRDIGHAAAYEAYRIWLHNRSIGDVRSDFGQRREAFIALAVAEVSHIFPFGQVHDERRKLREACETAAATASTIFHTLDDDGSSTTGSYVSGSSLGRSGSTSSDEFSDDLYVHDEPLMPRGSRRQRRSSSSVSFSSRPTVIPPNTSPYQPVSSMPMPIPGQQTYSYSGSSSYQPGGSPYQPGGSPYQPGGSPYQPGGSPYQPGGSPYSSTSHYPGPSSYPQHYPSNMQGVPVVGSSYDPNQQIHYQAAGSYPPQTYIQAQPGTTQAVPMPPGSTIIIQQPHRSKRHHKSSSRDSRRRHRSHSEAHVYPVY